MSKTRNEGARPAMHRRRSAKRLRLERDLSAAVLDTISSLVLVLNPQGRIVRFNRACEQLSGYAYAEVAGLFIWEIMECSGPEIAEPAFRALLAPDALPPVFETFLVTRQGERRLIAWSNAILRAESGAIEYVISTGTDITQRKEIEELRIKEAVIASSLSPIMVTDLDGHITYVNPAFAHLWGYETREEILGRQLAEFVLDREQAAEMLVPLKEYGYWIGEHLAVRKNGSLRFVQRSASVVRDQRGTPVCLASSFVDVTDRKAAEQSLRASEQRYRSIVETAQEGIWLIGEEGDTTFVNSKLAAMLGYTADEMMGRPFFDFVDQGAAMQGATVQGAAGQGGAGSNPLHAPRGARRMQQLLQERRDYCFIRRDGSRLWAMVKSSPLVDSQGEPTGALAMITDVTGRRQAEEALARYAAELELSNQELEQFAYVASHDLQEPLRMVASYVQLLAKDYQGQLGPEADEYIYYAVDGAKRMQRLIEDLLAYSRIGTRGRPFAPVDCNQVLQDVLHSLKLAADEAGAVITADELPEVQGDAAQLYQLLQNLIANAIKFHGDAPPAIHIGVQRRRQQGDGETPCWQFCVRDNGIGIDPQYFDRIFVIFQRLHSRAHYSGTGIGLALCKKIVERHGGRIWVESQPGRGATFCFTLPDRAAQGAGADGERQGCSHG